MHGRGVPFLIKFCYIHPALSWYHSHEGLLSRLWHALCVWHLIIIGHYWYQLKWILLWSVKKQHRQTILVVLTVEKISSSKPIKESCPFKLDDERAMTYQIDAIRMMRSLSSSFYSNNQTTAKAQPEWSHFLGKKNNNNNNEGKTKLSRHTHTNGDRERKKGR